MRSRAPCALALLAITACTGPVRIPEDDLEGKPWEVQKALLPPYPKEGDLTPIYASPARPFAYFVDADSVSVRQDRIVRYTLIARSASGATNVSYEGMRCETYESRSYAFGRPDGTWAQARGQSWSPFSRNRDDHLGVLADDVFCYVGQAKTVADIGEVLARMRRSKLPMRP